MTGKSGRFSEQVIVHFAKADREEMAIWDKIVVRSRGVGMALTEFPEVRLKSLAPELLRALGPRSSGSRLQVPVVAVIPAHLLGAGAGLTSEGGSLHLQSSDKEEMAARGLGGLRLGMWWGLRIMTAGISMGICGVPWGLR